jgi:hypothetical protein|tara:strand:+ start:1283 stop:1459 length:177 start_codon:yes stop_codon:yes gene_type:complete
LDFIAGSSPDDASRVRRVPNASASFWLDSIGVDILQVARSHADFVTAGNAAFEQLRLY